MTNRCMVVCPRDSDDPENWYGFVCAVPFETRAERDVWIRRHHDDGCPYDILIDGAWPMGEELREFLRGIVRERAHQEEFERQKRHWERTGRYS